MSKIRRKSGEGGGDDGGAGAGRAAGKRTLAESLPPGDPTAVATAGVSGGAMRVPHAEQLIEAAPEHRATIEGIQAHVGGPAAEAATALGARAYTIGNQIAFAAPPDLELAAHEVAHVIQQTGGVHVAGGVGQAGDAHEQEADAFASGVVSRSPSKLPTLQLGKPASAAVQKKEAAKGEDLKLHPPEDISEAVDRFRRGFGSGTRTEAELGWQQMSAADRVKFGQSPTIDIDLFAIIRVLHAMVIPIMGECGLDFAGREGLIDHILAVGDAGWFDLISSYGGTLLSSFIHHLPDRGRIDAASIAKLDHLMKGTNSLVLARPLFERIYTTVSDTSYDPNKVTTVPWTAAHIHRLYDVLASHLPLAHVRTITAFYLATNTDYAWWTNDSRVVIPAKDAKDGGGTDHRMTGGDRAQADPTTGKGETKGKGDRFDVAALHEVGHGVGGRLGGHAWAESYPFVGWQTKMTADAWSKGLWGDDATLTARAIAKVGKTAALASADARHYIAADLHSTAPLPPGFQTSDDVETAITTQYGDQKLTKYWQAQEGQDVTKSYLFSGTDNYSTDGNVYVWLNRGNSGYARYTQHAHQQKISWYSLASPHEWFAEQYAHYYRNQKVGAGLETGTKAKLDELDQVKPADNSLMAPGADSTSDSAGDSASTGAPGADRSTERRVPFPW